MLTTQAVIPRGRQRGILKGLGFLSRAAAFILTASIGRLFISDPIRKRRFSTRTSTCFTRWAVRGFDAHVQVINPPQRLSTRPFFLVANHVSDLDVSLLSSVMPLVFVASVEVSETNFLGTLARLGGAFFVERRNKFQLYKELGMVRQLLEQGFDVALFPEGTSSNGEGVLPFKNALFRAAIDAEAILLPVCLNYRRLNGQPLTVQNRDTVFYYGDMGFTAHLAKLVTTRSIDVECRFLPEIPLVKTDSRQEIAQKAQRAIAAHYTPIR